MSDKLDFGVVGARDFSPEITVHLIGTKVPCFDKVPPLQISIYRAAKSMGHMWPSVCSRDHLRGKINLCVKSKIESCFLHKND